ncbi:MAG: RHS repeat-associated core domain-containing protein [Desulfatirhabdiaceae bacterium]
MGLPRYWANTSTRNLVIDDTDLTYSGLGPQIAMTRTLNSNPKKIGMFGNGWTFSYESTIMTYYMDEIHKRAYLKKGSSEELLYSSDTLPPSKMIPPEGIYDMLTDLGTEIYLLEEKDTRHVYRYEDDPNQHNASRYLTSITDKNGNAVTITYNDNSTIQSITDAAGRKTSFEYDSQKHCTRMTGPDGRFASYRYDSRGNLIQTTDFAGNVTDYAHDSQNYVVSMTTAGKTTVFTYEPFSDSDPESPKRISAITDARGFTENYGGTYLEGISIPDANGGVFSYTNENGRTTSTLNSLGHATSKKYTAGLPTTWIDANGYTWNWGYDERGNMLFRYEPAIFSVTTFTYDENDNLLSMSNPLQETWQYAYDEKHNLIQRTSPSGRTEKMTYDSRGLVATATDAIGNMTEFAYDDFGNMTEKKDPQGNITRYAYDLLGFRKLSVTDSRNNTTSYAYDNNDRLTRITHPDGTYQSNIYDCCAMTASIDENGNMTSYERNAMLHPTKIINPLGHFKTLEYNPNNKLIKTTDANGNSTQTTYDLANRPVTTTDAAGGVITTSYDGNGNMLSLTDQQNKKYTFTFDGSNRLLGATDPLNNTVANTWDAAGRISRVTNARNQVIAFEYNTEGEVISKKYDGSQVATYSYDLLGNISQTTDATGQTSFARDAMGRVTAINYPDGTALATTYDAAGNIASISYPGGLTVSYTYDSRNRVTGIVWDGNTIAMTYDGPGNILTETRSNGTSSRYTYDANNNMSEFHHTRGETSFARGTFVRDPVGNIIQESVDLPVLPIFSAMSETGTYNAVNQLISSGGNTYTYDTDGNLTGISGTKTLAATYDPENRLTSITRNTTKTYTYGATGNRVRAVDGAQTRNYHHDSFGRLMFETDGVGLVTVYYIYRNSSPVAMGTPLIGWQTYHQGRTGNMLALTDGGGVVVRAYAYSPFGEIINQSGHLYNPFTFAGGYGVLGDEGGIYFMKNRFYDAATGKFMHKDPIGLEGGSNLYAYVGNNPINQVDPTGLVGGRDMQDPYAKDKNYQKARHDFDCYVIDKAIGIFSFWGGVTQGVSKALGYAVEGDYDGALKEVIKTVTGPLGTIFDFSEDLGYEPPYPTFGESDIQDRENHLPTGTRSMGRD